MTHLAFDVTITLNDHHFAATGLSGSEAAAVVRQAIQQVDGAGWIDVEAQSYPTSLPGWVILYPPGRAAAPDTSEWRDLQRRIEMVATAALHWLGCYPRRHDATLIQISPARTEMTEWTSDGG